MKLYRKERKLERRKVKQKGASFYEKCFNLMFTRYLWKLLGLIIYRLEIHKCRRVENTGLDIILLRQHILGYF